MTRRFTTRQVARSLHVSEASVKRWCDKGYIKAELTGGGHRRISLPELLHFLRNTNRQLADPTVLGLPATSGQGALGLDRGRSKLVEALIAGDEAAARQIVLDLVMAEYSIAVICDNVLAGAFDEIGSLWECKQAEVYQERRGCEICLRVLREIRSLTLDPPPDAPIAIGGAPEGDQYSLGTAMAELVLRDARWNAMSLGDNLPLSTLGAAIRHQRPRLFWLSCSYLANPPLFLHDFNRLFEQYGDQVLIVVGGRALTPELLDSMRFATHCVNMQKFVDLADSLRGQMGSSP